MSYFAIAYPGISNSDFDWIQGVRRKNDQQFKQVKPHITLVFGTVKLNSSDFTNHITNKIRGFKSFRITLDSAVIIEDNSKTHFHVFLVPSAGFNEINELHERLYQGEMKSELRHDIPFVPHITVGSGSREDMAALVNKINESNISINGNVDQVSIVSFDGVEVKDIAKLSLA